MEDSRSAEASRRVFVSFNKIGGLGVPEFILMGWEGWDGMGRHFGSFKGRRIIDQTP